jgi:hypothetical protein
MRIVSICLISTGIAAIGGSILFGLYLFTHRPGVPSPVDGYIYEYRLKWLVVYVGVIEQYIAQYLSMLGIFFLIVGKYFQQRQVDSTK